MNILKIKEQINSWLGKRVRIKVNIGRNKFEYYEGEIVGTYPYLFTVNVDNQIKSFSYVEILTKDVQLKIINAWFMEK